MGTDKTFYRWARHSPRGLLALAGLVPDSKYRFESITAKKIEIERQLDCLLEPLEPGLPLIFVEFQGYKSKDFLSSLCVKILIRLKELKYSGPVDALVVYLRKSHRSTLTLGNAQKPFLNFAPREIFLSELSAADLMVRDEPELLVLLPLSKTKKAEVAKRLSEWGAEIRHRSATQAEGKELLALLMLFASHRLPERSEAELTQQIGGFVMEETRVGREFGERWEKRGEKRGEKVGRMKECQELLRRMVNRRFRSVPAWLERWLNSQTIPDHVEEIIESLYEVTSVEELRTRLA